jgi:hypothetical protein
MVLTGSAIQLSIDVYTVNILGEKQIRGDEEEGYKGDNFKSNF